MPYTFHCDHMVGGLLTEVG